MSSQSDVAVVELDGNAAKFSDIIDQIVRLEKKIFPKHESLARSFVEEVKKRNSGLLYANVKGEVAGYVMYSWPSFSYASITKLAVKENRRRQGLGKALLSEAIQKCKTRKIQRICLHVDPLRKPAIGLYQKMGFKIDTFIESYYSPDRNAYRMYLDFDL